MLFKHGERWSIIKLPTLAGLNEAGTTNNNSGKSSCAYSNLKQQQFLNILLVLSWCEWHMQVDAIFVNGWHEDDMEYLLPWPKERGAIAAKTETMPRQRSGSDNSLRCRWKRRVAWASHANMVGYSRLPGVRRWHGKRGALCNEQLKHGAKHGSTHTSQAFVHGHRLGVIPLKRPFLKRFEFVEESSGTRGS